MATTKGYVLNLSDTAQTTNATPTVVATVPVSTNQAVTVTVGFTGVKTTYVDTLGGQVVGTFSRAAGNIARASTPLISTINSLALATAGISLVANTGTQTVDITLTGVAATTIKWSYQITSIYAS